MHSSHADLIENPFPRVLVQIIVDCTSAMSGDLIAGLSQGLKHLALKLNEYGGLAAMHADVAVTAFVPPPLKTGYFNMAYAEFPPLIGDRHTLVETALWSALAQADARKAVLKRMGVARSGPPICILITNTTPSAFSGRLVTRMLSYNQGGKHAFYAVALDEADIDVLASVCNPGRPPLRLKYGQFEELFTWLYSLIACEATPRQPPYDIVPVSTWAVNSEVAAGWELGSRQFERLSGLWPVVDELLELSDGPASPLSDDHGMFDWEIGAPSFCESVTDDVSARLEHARNAQIGIMIEASKMGDGVAVVQPLIKSMMIVQALALVRRTVYQLALFIKVKIMLFVDRFIVLHCPRRRKRTSR